MEESQTPNDLQIAGSTSEKVDLAALINAKRINRPYGPNRPASPRPIEVKASKNEKGDSNSFLSGNVADAMNENFAKSMSGSVGYNDNADMDQQSQEYWGNL